MDQTTGNRPPSEYRPVWIDLDGAANARDVAGLPAARGRTRSNVLLRADALDALSARDVAELTDHRGLRHVVDLRSDGERAERGRGLLGERDAVRYTELQIIDEGQLLQRRTEREQMLADGVPIAHIMADGYVQLLDWGAASFVTAFRAVTAHEGVPALVHCSAGKDRTGVLVALLLGAGGVGTEAIVADYAATGERMAAVIARLETASIFAGMAAALPAFTFDAHPETMRRFLAHLEQTWGGPAGWLTAQGVAGDEIERWQHTLVDPG